ncbi:peptidoglycan DD-metalloendopeptidase family protein [Aquipuribacter hungaricus]|uniref:Peptidoglycan DD-metalloendopeptidase family protein n=1 Tax=Aquipuribacter hungaricus TaxID=545624 RepID=A0ABV7WKV1_9MICO
MRNHVRGRSCCAVLLAMAVVLGTPAAASTTPEDREGVEQRQGEVREGLDSSRQELDEVGAELSAASERLAGLQARLPGARAAVEKAAADVTAARQRDAELTVELSLAEAAVTAAGLQLQERTGAADETEKVVAGVAREVYQGSGFTPLTILVDADSAGEYADMVAFAAVARRSQNQALSRLRVQQVDIRNAEARLEAERARVEDLKRLAAEQVVATEAAEAAARDAQDALETLVAQEDQAVATFEAAKAAEEAEIAALEVEEQKLVEQLAAIAEAERLAELERQRQLELERQRLAELERQRVAELERQRQVEIQRQREQAERDNRPAPAPPPPVTPRTPQAPPAPQAPSGSGFLSRPVVGARISSQFGYRIHPILGYRKLHAGTDFAAPCGTPITAAADGTVVTAGWGGGFGNLVVIAHGNVGGSSLATAYAHQSRLAVSAGQTVSRGQVIGYIGTTGSSTGCHLHLETRLAGTPVDPMRYL